MGRMFMFWNSFIDFYLSDNCPEDVSMNDAMEMFLSNLDTEVLIKYRDAHLTAFDMFNEHLGRRS